MCASTGFRCLSPARTEGCIETPVSATPARWRPVARSHAVIAGVKLTQTATTMGQVTMSTSKPSASSWQLSSIAIATSCTAIKILGAIGVALLVGVGCDQRANLTQAPTNFLSGRSSDRTSSLILKKPFLRYLSHGGDIFDVLRHNTR